MRCLVRSTNMKLLEKELQKKEEEFRQKAAIYQRLAQELLKLDGAISILKELINKEEKK